MIVHFYSDKINLQFKIYRKKFKGFLIHVKCINIRFTTLPPQFSSGCYGKLGARVQLTLVQFGYAFPSRTNVAISYDILIFLGFPQHLQLIDKIIKKIIAKFFSVSADCSS